MSNPIDVSVVVPFYNRRHEVARCLGALRRQVLDGLRVEIIAVDNMSTDGTLEELSRHGVRVVECHTRGPAAARNAGIRAATGELIAFTDSDCTPHREWLRRLVAPMREDPRIRLSGGRIRPRSVAKGVEIFADEFRVLDQAKFFRAAHTFPPFFATANACYRRADLDAVGGFDESLWMCEDADLSWRILDLGGGIAYCHDAVVLHSHRETFEGLYRQARDYGAGGVALVAKHRDRLRDLPLFDYNAILRLALTPFKLAWDHVVQPNPAYKKWALYEAVYHTGFLAGRWKAAWKHRTLYL